MKEMRIAAAIFRSQTGQMDRNVDYMIHWISSAKKQGASIICFPEMNITGYRLHKDIQKIAQPNPGPITRRLQRIAKTEDIVILAGMAEKDETGRIFITHVVVDPDIEFGKALEGYRKTHLSPPEQDLYYRGNDIPLFKTRGLCFGIQLCYDAHFPELSSRMAMEGADVIFFPHASPRGTPEEKYRSWMRHLTARAFDNGLYIIACNPLGNTESGLEFPGVAVSVGPSGKVTHKNLTGKEGILLVEIKKDILDGVRGHRMRYFLPNRREALYRRHGR